MARGKGSKKLRVALLMLCDLACIVLSMGGSLWIRFQVDGAPIPHYYLMHAMSLLPIWALTTLLVFYVFRLYNSLWAYASIREAGMACLATTVSTGTLIIYSLIFSLAMPRSCFFLVWVWLTALTVGLRVAYRVTRNFHKVHSGGKSTREQERIMIIGAGDAGNALIREFKTSQHLNNAQVVCVIDDDLSKFHRYISGVKVIGGKDKIAAAVEKYHINEIIFAIPSADRAVRREYIELCKDTGCVIKTLPGVYQLVNGEVSIQKLRKVEIEDLLGRDPIALNLDNIGAHLTGKTVLVTGAGGSIGSELCRQIASFTPKCLLLFDIYENTTYFVQNEIHKKYPDLQLVTLIGSVRDTDRLDYLFSTYRPDIVYHAAAHKHVPLMEYSPNEAVKNNVFGTLNMVQAADRYHVSRFVMISTDKAVNPTNIMGATKRICEMIVQSYNRKSKTEFVAVRFGNVLGSNGSVIPIFQKQIENGGPVTVTHPDITRYFMTIPEAVSLVMEAGALAKGGEIFVLDMGEPVKILTLAENMVRLAGLVPYKDIEIAFSGLRPGEKIREELLMSEEGLGATSNKQIFVGKPIDFNEFQFQRQIELLRDSMADERADIRALVHDIVPTYRVIALGEVAY